MVWCGVVWCGVVWCGVVWCGVVNLFLCGLLGKDIKAAHHGIHLIDFVLIQGWQQ